MTRTRLFGTDGIRGLANVELTPDLALALGRAVSRRLLRGGETLVIGQDTRRSGDMLAAALVAGATAEGTDVHRIGVAPTPALAHITEHGPFAAGVMVSASHNPARDNGLKVLDSTGQKLSDELEDELQDLMDGGPARTPGRDALPGNDGLGRDITAEGWLERYVDHRREIARAVPSSARVILDCANGSGALLAPDLLRATGASVEAIFDMPDGTNINAGCGATSPDALAARVRAGGVEVGFALDGDADRCVAVDEGGRVVDGDQLIGLLALDALDRGQLAGRSLVVSVLSNGGLQAALEQRGGTILRTPVGDKHILLGMRQSGASLGGEKSGHVILLQHASTGDGVVTALATMQVMARRGRPLSELAAEIPLFPQQQRAVLVRHKDRWLADASLTAAIAEVEAELRGQGRVLVRPSGTEPALRIMIEGEDEARVSTLADQLAALAGERLN